MRVWPTAGAIIAILLVVVFSKPMAGAVINFHQECLQLYSTDACDQRRVGWLTTFGHAAQWWGQATWISTRDGFIYGDAPLDKRRLGFDGPDDGTFFVEESPGGPPKGRVVYDDMHRIVLYDVGCCSWHDVIAARDVSRPPSNVVHRNLVDLKTVRGVQLGMSPARVLRIYGPATKLQVPHHADLVVLAYTTWPPARSLRNIPDPCGQFENFVFRKDVLIYIQFGNGC